MRCIAFLALALCSLVPCQAQNLIPNAEFDQGVSGWTPPTFYPNTLLWDPSNSAFGPGGSAILTSPYGVGGSFIRTISPCMSVTPGVTYSWGGQYRFGTAVITDAFLFSLQFTNDPGCTNPVSLTNSPGRSPVQDPPGPWRTLAGPDVTAPPGATGAVVIATMAENIDSELHTLSLDDVYFGPRGTVGPNQAPAIPTLSQAGLYALALGLGAAALWLLRRR